MLPMVRGALSANRSIQDAGISMKSISTVLLTSILLASVALPAQAAASGDDDSGLFTGDFYVSFGGRIDGIDWKSKDFDAKDRTTTTGSLSSSTTSVNTDQMPETLMGPAMAFGYKFSPYFATEIGIAATSDENRVTDNDANRYRYRMSIRQVSLDGYAYWPLGDTGRFRPFLTAGLAYVSGNSRVRTDIDGTDDGGIKNRTLTLTTFFHKHELDWRAGLGLEIGITQDVSARVYGRYQPYSFGSNLNGGATFGFDVNVAVF